MPRFWAVQSGASSSRGRPWHDGLTTQCGAGGLSLLRGMPRGLRGERTGKGREGVNLCVLFRQREIGQLDWHLYSRSALPPRALPRFTTRSRNTHPSFGTPSTRARRVRPHAPRPAAPAAPIGPGPPLSPCTPHAAGQQCARHGLHYLHRVTPRTCRIVAAPVPVPHAAQTSHTARTV